MEAHDVTHAACINDVHADTQELPVTALLAVLGMIAALAALAAYAIHKTKASRVKLSAGFWKLFHFSFEADSPSGPEERPAADDEP
jgi:hypothetical protein